MILEPLKLNTYKHVEKYCFVLWCSFRSRYCLGSFFVETINVTVTESQAQAAIDRKMDAGPIQSRGVELTLNSAAIDFRANDTAEITVDFIADGYGYSGEVVGNFASGIRYDEPRVYLDNIVPLNIELSADSETTQKIQDVKNVATDFLTRQREQMLSEEAKESLDNIVGRNAENLNEIATSVAYKFFETLPIYNLNDAGIKGSLASLALKEVRFSEDAAIITLSPAQALLKILTFVGLVFLTAWMFFGFYIPRQREK